MIVWLVLGGIVIVGIIWLVVARIRRASSRRYLTRRSPGLEILDDRYARGEINRDEYLQKREDIRA
jgi:putative membrane protein